MPTACGDYGIGDDFPVYCVSWDDVAGAGGFIETHNAHLTAAGSPEAGEIRLPTEAEWERAARAGTQTRFSHGDVLECGDDCEACPTNDAYMLWCGNDNESSEPVGSRLPNGYFLYDMHGNLTEWVQDWYTPYLGTIPQVDPTGPDPSGIRAERDGSWPTLARLHRSAARLGHPPGGRSRNNGFRLAMYTYWNWSKSTPAEPVQ